MIITMNIEQDGDQSALGRNGWFTPRAVSAFVDEHFSEQREGQATLHLSIASSRGEPIMLIVRGDEIDKLIRLLNTARETAGQTGCMSLSDA